eukprot:jgi/Galph1/1854/GphlegSOOS_G524.1
MWFFHLSLDGTGMGTNGNEQIQEEKKDISTRQMPQLYSSILESEKDMKEKGPTDLEEGIRLRRGEILYRKFRGLNTTSEQKNDDTIQHMDATELLKAIEYWKKEAYENFQLLIRRLGFLGAVTIYSLWGMAVSDRTWGRVTLPSSYDPQTIANYFRIRPEKVVIRSLSVLLQLGHFTVGLLVDSAMYGLFGPTEEDRLLLPGDNNINSNNSTNGNSSTKDSHSKRISAMRVKGPPFQIFRSFQMASWITKVLYEDNHMFSRFSFRRSRKTHLENKLRQKAFQKHEYWEWRWQRRAALLRETLTRLGPAFVKFGQTLASRPDIVGHYGVCELQKLQDSLPYFPTQTAFEFITEELGASPYQIFEYISTEPAAAASLGQVYKAQLDNVDVAVKVQRPDMAENIALDTFILRWFAFLIGNLFRSKTDFMMAVDEFGTRLYEEIDYKNESFNMIRFRQLYGDIPGIYIPAVFEEYSTRRILVMEWVDGQKIVNEGNVIREEDAALIEIGIQFSLKQLLETGFLHADPHGGNLVRMKDGRLAYLDFGLVSYVPESTMNSMICAFFHLMNGDYESLAEDFAGLALIQSNDLDNNMPQFVNALKETFGREEKFSFHGLPEKLVFLASSFPFVVPPYFLNNLRALSTLESLAVTVDGSFDVKNLVYPYVVSRMLYDPAPQLQHCLQSYIIEPETGVACWDRVETILHDAVVASIQSESHIIRSYIRNSSSRSFFHSVTISRPKTEDELTADLFMRFIASPGGSFLREILISQFSSDIVRYIYQLIDEVEGIILPENLRPVPASPLLSTITGDTCGSSGRQKQVFMESIQDNHRRVLKLLRSFSGYRLRTLLLMAFFFIKSFLKVLYVVSSLLVWRLFRDLKVIFRGVALGFRSLFGSSKAQSDKNSVIL